MQQNLIEAIAAADAEVASFQMILGEEWLGDAQCSFAALDTAVKELDNAKGKFERIADEL